MLSQAITLVYLLAVSATAAPANTTHLGKRFADAFGNDIPDFCSASCPVLLTDFYACYNNPQPKWVAPVFVNGHPVPTHGLDKRQNSAGSGAIYGQDQLGTTIIKGCFCSNAIAQDLGPCRSCITNSGDQINLYPDSIWNGILSIEGFNAICNQPPMFASAVSYGINGRTVDPPAATVAAPAATPAGGDSSNPSAFANLPPTTAPLSIATLTPTSVAPTNTSTAANTTSTAASTTTPYPTLAGTVIVTASANSTTSTPTSYKSSSTAAATVTQVVVVTGGASGLNVEMGVLVLVGLAVLFGSA